MLAIISDLHANLEALEAVLGDIDQRGIKRIICLGDIVGYGPNPKECLDLVVDRCEVTVCGNHDQAVFYEPYSFNIGAERSAFWARQVLENDPDKTRRNSRWEYLGNLFQPLIFESHRKYVFVLLDQSQSYHPSLHPGLYSLPIHHPRSYPKCLVGSNITKLTAIVMIINGPNLFLKGIGLFLIL